MQVLNVSKHQGCFATPLVMFKTRSNRLDAQLLKGHILCDTSPRQGVCIDYKTA